MLSLHCVRLTPLSLLRKSCAASFVGPVRLANNLGLIN